MGVSVYVEKMSDGGHDFAGMYAEGIPPWQIDRPQPEVIQLIEQGKFESLSSIWVVARETIQSSWLGMGWW